MSAVIEIPRPVTQQTAEHVHRRSVDMKKSWDANRHLAECAFRAVRARDPKLLLVLDKMAEALEKTNEEQLGRTQRDSGTEWEYRLPPTEVKLWREAYRLADKGEPEEAFAWMYAAAAEWAGILY